MKPRIIPLRTLASGEKLGIPVFEFRGQGGPSAYIQASLHGSEVQGNWVIAELLERISRIELLGDLTLVPCANPYAQNLKFGEFTFGRFDPTSGENWNRSFFDLSHLAESVSTDWPSAKIELSRKILQALRLNPAQTESHSRSLSRILQTLAAPHDFMLDLHCASLCESHAYVPEYAFSSFTDLPCRHAVKIGPEFAGAMDEAFFAPWWKLADRIQAASGNFPEIPQGFTLELGHQDWSNPSLAAQQAEGILHFLSRKGVVRGNFTAMKFPSRYSCELRNLRTHYSPKAGFVSLRSRLGEVQDRNEPYCEFIRFKDYSKEVLPCPESMIPLVFTNASSVHEGTELGKSLTHYSEVKP